MLKLCETCVHFRNYKKIRVWENLRGGTALIGHNSLLICKCPSETNITVNTDTNEEKCTGYADKRGCGKVSIVKTGLIRLEDVENEKEDD